jgi:hypothetical protein
MASSNNANGGLLYEFVVKGVLPEKLETWINCLTLTTQNVDSTHSVTNLIIRVRDKAELHGIINRLFDLNLRMLSLRVLEDQ